MAQWAACKAQAGDAILLFRLGDFYEAFEDDAVKASQALELTLTKRQGIPMCGVPWHSSEGYIDRLLVKGFSVAIAEQVPSTTPSTGSKPIMERKVVRVLTPATAMQGSLIQDSSHSLFVSIAKSGSSWGVALIDVTTALFQVFEVEEDSELLHELFRLRPKELLCSQTLLKQEEELCSQIEESLDVRITTAPSWTFDGAHASSTLKSHFSVATLDGFGLRELPLSVSAAGALIFHIKDRLLVALSHIKKIETLSRCHHMLIDRSTLFNLDIFENSSRSPGALSLYGVLNKTETPMGARLLRTWMLNPLLDREQIVSRQLIIAKAIGFIKEHPTKTNELSEHLRSIRDIERLILRIQTGTSGPRDVLFLAQCCSHVSPVQAILEDMPIAEIDSVPDLSSLIERVGTTITDEPPLRISDGNTIRSGVNSELDELHSIRKDSHAWLVEYQARLREELDIKTLKVGFSRAFGYFIEVSRASSDKVPSSFARRQTLTNAERYISEELKSYEDKALTAEKRIEGLEAALFEELKSFVVGYAEKIVTTARHIAEVDLFFALAHAAIVGNYIQPKIVTDPVLNIKDGRHPIAELQHLSHAFVPNDLDVDATGKSMLLITGPNMAGKSTYVRQSALLVLMAQIGSFIPARDATIGIVDRVFSRVGANDDLSKGQSTFMVEMAETAQILNQATPRSLILLDEIGRGTSTYDGISIAWSVVEFLLRHKTENPRTLFATHYHELTDLAKQYSSIKNLTVAITESEKDVSFLYKVVEGTTDRSYGIHVAKLAGLPVEVIKRAESVLEELEEKHPKSSFVQQELFTIAPPAPPEDPKALACYDFLTKLDLVKMTPLDCFLKLTKFQKTLT